MRRLIPALLVVVGLAAIGCSKNIGDGCSSNVDCSASGTRFCDTSTPGGYCTIDGCDVSTCPEEAVCVRFFSLLRNTSCAFDPENPTGHGLAEAPCPIDQRCLCDGLLSAGQCPAGQAHCAPESTERRWCQLRCTSNADCRAGYDCKPTGALGAEAVPEVGDLGTTVKQARFCAPRD